MVDDMFSDSGKKAVELNEDRGLPLPFNSLKTYLAEVARHPLLTKEKEREIALLVFENNDQDAAQELVMSNLRLVVKIALQYYNMYFNVLDLIQEGNVGILHAVKKYNPYKGTKFSSYASYWIRAYILKYIMDSWSLVKLGTTAGQRKLFRFEKRNEKTRSPRHLSRVEAYRELSQGEGEGGRRDEAESFLHRCLP
jgi:RNA polymerase sigma-32 factor